MKYALLLLALTGCAGPQYWYKEAQPVLVTRTIYADVVICEGVEAWGCADRQNGIAYVSKKAPFHLWDCIARHERVMHLEGGYSHPHGLRLGGVWCDETTFVGE